MASMGFNVMNCCSLYWIIMQVSASGETFLMNISVPWNESRQYCEGIGKAFFDVIKDGYDNALKSLLNETDQAWVAATVELSHFIKQPVCLKTTGLKFDAKKFDTNILGNCLKFCEGNLYIGLKDRDCICFTKADNLNRSTLCNVKCNNDPIHLCGGNESISLYEKVDTSVTKKIAPNAKECVYAQKTTNGTDLFTASCVWQLTDGGICEGGNYTACKAHNWTPFGKELCRMDLPSPFGWNQTRKFCADIGGQLSSQTESWMMKDNLTYWLGFRRISTFHRANGLQLNKKDTYCAVVRKKGDVVLIEGEDCLQKNAILCQDKEILESTSSLTTKPNEKTNERTRTDSDLAESMTSNVVAAVSTPLIVVLVITVLVCVVRRHKRSRHTEVSASNSSGDHHILLERQSANPPPKPSRKAYSTKGHIQSSYENVVLGRSEQSVMIQHLGHSNSGKETYDRIDLDKVHKDNKNSTGDDLHVYDHTSLHMTEDHYDQTALSGNKSPNLEETYDRTTLRQQLDTENSISVRDGQVDYETYKQADNDYVSTNGHY